MQGKKYGKKKPSRTKGGSWDGRGTEGKWSSVHKFATHSDPECWQQGSPRPQGDAFTAAVLDARTPLLADDNEKPTFKSNDDFRRWFLVNGVY